MRALPLALVLLLAACAQAPQQHLASQGNTELLDRLPAALGTFTAETGASPQLNSATRRYRMRGAQGIVNLGRPPETPPVADGPEAAGARQLVEHLTRSLMARVQPEPGFGPWRREADLTFQRPSLPALHCSALRRPRGEAAQVQYFCITGLHGRYLTVGMSVNHTAMSALSAQNLASTFSLEVTRLLATGEGLAAPQPVLSAPGAAKPPAAPPPEDDAVPEG